MTEELLAKTVL